MAINNKDLDDEMLEMMDANSSITIDSDDDRLDWSVRSNFSKAITFRMNPKVYDLIVKRVGRSGSINRYINDAVIKQLEWDSNKSSKKR